VPLVAWRVRNQRVAQLAERRARPLIRRAGRSELVRIGMALAGSDAPDFMSGDMRGSNYREYVVKCGSGVTLFSIRLGDRTLWGWFSMDAAGTLRGHSKVFFHDYVTCLCDSQRSGMSS